MECKWQITNRHCFRLRHSLFPTIMRAPTVCVWRGLRFTIYLLPRRPHLRTAEMHFTPTFAPTSSPASLRILPFPFHARTRNPSASWKGHFTCLPACLPARHKYAANISVPALLWKWSRFEWTVCNLRAKHRATAITFRPRTILARRCSEQTLVTPAW